MNCKQALAKREKGLSGRLWTIIGGAALVLVAAAVVANLSDIKRYIKISTM